MVRQYETVFIMTPVLSDESGKGNGKKSIRLYFD